MLDTIREAWSWTGLNPVEVVDENLFGNLIVRAADGTYWRICPEEFSCQRVAANAKEFVTLSRDEEFRTDWEMTRLVDEARRALGPLAEGWCYCLKVPTVIGGSYDVANMGTITRTEVIYFSGYLAEQIKDVPDGGQIEFEIIR